MQSPTPLNTNTQPKPRRRIGSVIVLVLLLTGSWFIWTNLQYVIDSVHFWSYQPTTAVAAVERRAALSDSGKFMFYASQPTIDGSATFNNECQRQESGTAILGCYANNRIYIYDVTDARLDGIKEVTAAHEMLHAVYERLSPADKSSVDGMVEKEYDKLKGDPAYAERMAFYARTEPGQRDNELHSIIGTEVGSLSPELEAHYAKYFSDRSKVVALFASYNGVFTSLSNQASQLSAQLDKISSQIKTETATYNADVERLNSDIADFNQRAASGAFRTQSQFASERAALVSRSNQVMGERDSINALISQFNTLREQYNSTVTQSNNLYKSIDSSLAPAPQV